MSKTFHVTAPDGHVLEITGPDDATEEQALAQAQAQYQPGMAGPNAAIKAQQAAKYPTAAEGGKPNLPWWAGYFSQDRTRTADRTAGQVASDQAANAINGVSQAVTGIPTVMGHVAKMGWKGATQPMSVPGMVKETAQGLAHSIADPVVPVIKAAAGYAPSPESPEWSDAAQGAGAQFGGLMLGEAAKLPQVQKGANWAASEMGQKVTSMMNKAKPLVKSPGLDAPMINKWMDVPAKGVMHGQNPGQQLLNEKLLGATKEATQANVKTALADAGAKMDVHLKNATAKGVTIDAQTPTYDAVASAMKRIGSPRDATFQAQMNGIVDDIEARYPNLHKLTPVEAHALKVDLGDAIRWTGQAADTPANQAMMQIYRDLNGAIKSSVPDIAQTQTRWGNLHVASKALKESLAEDLVGKGSGAAIPPKPLSPLQHAAKLGVKWALPPVLGATGYKIFRDLDGH